MSILRISDPRVRTAWLLLAAVLLSIAVVAPFFLARVNDPVAPDVYRIPNAHDVAQHLAVMKQFHVAQQSGDLYPRWQAEFNKGYGLPWLNYYPPGFYFLSEPFYLLLHDWVFAFLGSTLLLMIGSGVAFYLLARQFHSRAASAVSAAFYMVAPYHTIDLYWRGAFPELTGFVFAPLVLLAASKAGETGRLRWIAALGLSQGIYLVFHFPLSYLLLIVLFVYACAWSWMRHDVRTLMRISAGVALALGVGACYWLVALLERKHVWEPFSQIYQYARSYLTLAATDDPCLELLNESFLGLAAALAVSIAVVRVSRFDRRLRRRGAERSGGLMQIRLFRWLGLACTFMVLPYSNPIAALIPHINAISFAWRWLLLGSFFTALALAPAIDVVIGPTQLRRDRRILLTLTVAAVLAGNAALTVKAMMLPLKRTNPNVHAPLGRPENGFRPGRARDVSTLPETEKAMLIPADAGVVTEITWGPVERIVDVSLSAPATVRLKTYNFRGWKAWLDGRPAPMSGDADRAQLVAVPPGRHRLVVRFGDLRTHNIAETISVLSALAAVVMIVVDRERRRSVEEAALSGLPG